MTPTDYTREGDQRILDALYLRDNGFTFPQIAKRLGFPSVSGLRGLFSRIRTELEASE
jgi:hypothetical protein